MEQALAHGKPVVLAAVHKGVFERETREEPHIVELSPWAHVFWSLHLGLQDLCLLEAPITQRGSCPSSSCNF